MANLTATAEVDVDAPVTRVWAALTDPDIIRRYFFGTNVETDWQPGNTIIWKGEYEGKQYEDKGQILEVEPEKRMRLTHFSPMTGQPDVPENYHTLEYLLEEQGGRTHVTLTQDNNADEAEVQRSTQNWEMVLNGLKKAVESEERG